MRRPDLGGPLGSRGVWLAIVSHHRATNIGHMTRLAGPATWVIAPDDVDAYTPLASATGGALLVSQPGISHARNAALEAAFALGLPCLMLDDDLRAFAVAEACQTRAGGLRLRDRPATLAETLALLWEARDVTGAKLLGVAPSDNPLSSRLARPIATHHFVNGSLTLTLPNPLRYDPSLALKEDYDYTLQHLARYGVVGRADRALPAFQHRANAGGAVDLRSAAVERAAIAILMRRWPGLLRPNPRRPNEVLLTWPRAAVSHSGLAREIHQMEQSGRAVSRRAGARHGRAATQA